MREPIRILHLEDSPRDAEILHDQLAADGLACDITLAGDRPSFEKALAAGPWDVILCDYNLPGYDGLSALQLAREKYPAIPVIMLSGSLSPEEAVECLRAGATDYLLKQRAERLASAVQQALKQGKDRQARRAAEEALRQSEERFRLLAECSSEVFWFIGLNPERILYVSPAVENVWGLPPTTFYRDPHAWIEAIHPDDQPRVRAAYAEWVAEQEGNFEQEYRVVQPDGAIRWVSDHGMLTRSRAKPASLASGIACDITGRKQAEQALRESEANLAALIENTEDLVWSVDRHHRLTVANSAFRKAVARALGRDIQNGELVLADVFPPEELRQWKAYYGRALSGEAFAQETQGRCEDGEQQHREHFFNPIRTADGAVVGVSCFSRDITARVRADQQIREALATLDATEDGAFIFDPETLRFTYVNEGTVRQLGFTREELLAMRAPDIKPEFTEAAFLAAIAPLRRGKTSRLQYITPLRHKQGHDIPMEINLQYVALEGARPRFIAIARDITGRQKAERLALRSQRLEAIGTLAGGVAHDLNNSLAPIMMGVEILRMKYPEENQTLDLFLNCARRGAALVRQLLGFAKGVEGRHVALQVSRSVKEIESMMQGSFPKNIELAVRCEPQLPLVKGDPTQLHQILLNLCVNARDAMPNGGTLALEARRMEVDDAYASSIPEAKPGTYVALRVRDTGTGIPPEIIDRIFDPFFTTKGPDKGTGLGLSTVMGIVKGHGGFLQVDSRPGHGTTFAVHLPADHSGDDTNHAAKPADTFQGRGETILFVDDEAALRDVAGSVLRRLGFNPLVAVDGMHGLVQVAEHRNELRAIITDLHMPHLDGVNFVRSLLRILPDIPIAVASGRMEEKEKAEFAALNVKVFLNKPFTQGQLAEALRSLLEPNLAPSPGDVHA